jgi:hypothetical protein
LLSLNYLSLKRTVEDFVVSNFDIPNRIRYFLPKLFTSLNQVRNESRSILVVFFVEDNKIVTLEERRLLTDLASKISQTPPPPRDPEAEDFIRKNIGSRPDALYLMTQTVLIQNMAIQQAQEQIRDLQQRSAPQAGYSSPGGGSFLGQAPQFPQQPQYAAPQPAYAPSPSALASGSGQGSGPGFLKGAAQTAAGVAAGALAFEGIRSLFSHPGYGMGGGLGLGQTGFMGGGAPVEETVVNNYYDSARDEGRGAESLADTSDDQSDDNNDDGQTQDADYDDSSDDSSSFDDSSDVA